MQKPIVFAAFLVVLMGANLVEGASHILLPGEPPGNFVLAHPHPEFIQSALCEFSGENRTCIHGLHHLFGKAGVYPRQHRNGYKLVEETLEMRVSAGAAFNDSHLVFAGRLEQSSVFRAASLSASWKNFWRPNLPEEDETTDTSKPVVFLTPRPEGKPSETMRYYELGAGLAPNFELLPTSILPFSSGLHSSSEADGLAVLSIATPNGEVPAAERKGVMYTIELFDLSGSPSKFYLRGATGGRSVSSFVLTPNQSPELPPGLMERPSLFRALLARSSNEGEKEWFVVGMIGDETSYAQAIFIDRLKPVGTGGGAGGRLKLVSRHYQLMNSEFSGVTTQLALSPDAAMAAIVRLTPSGKIDFIPFQPSNPKIDLSQANLLENAPVFINDHYSSFARLNGQKLYLWGASKRFPGENNLAIWEIDLQKPMGEIGGQGRSFEISLPRPAAPRCPEALWSYVVRR